MYSPVSSRNRHYSMSDLKPVTALVPSLLAIGGKIQTIFCYRQIKQQILFIDCKLMLILAVCRGQVLYVALASRVTALAMT